MLTTSGAGSSGFPAARGFGWVAWGAAAAMLVGSAAGPGRAPAWVMCPILYVSGHPCPGCGMTRSLSAILHADWAAAWALHPFGFPVFVLLLAVLAWPLAGRFLPWTAAEILSRRWVQCALGALGLAFVGFGVFRGIAA